MWERESVRAGERESVRAGECEALNLSTHPATTTQSSFVASHLSASMAAIQPEPAAVTA
jgi:hypothetical protein